MKYLLLVAFMLPLFVFSQTTKYDSLYKAGAIDKAEYDLLTKAAPVDSTQLKLAKYNGMLKAKLITPAEYEKLKDAILFAKPGDPSYKPEEDRKLARANTGVGITFLIVGNGLAGAGIGIHVNNGGFTPGSVITGCFGGLLLGASIGLLVRGGELRRRAKQYERDQMMRR